MVFDGAGGDIGRAAFRVTARGGRFSTYGSASGAFAEIAQGEAEAREVTLLSPEQVHLGGTVLP